MANDSWTDSFIAEMDKSFDFEHDGQPTTSAFARRSISKTKYPNSQDTMLDDSQLAKLLNEARRDGSNILLENSKVLTDSDICGQFDLSLSSNFLLDTEDEVHCLKGRRSVDVIEPDSSPSCSYGRKGSVSKSKFKDHQEFVLEQNQLMESLKEAKKRPQPNGNSAREAKDRNLKGKLESLLGEKARIDQEIGMTIWELAKNSCDLTQQKELNIALGKASNFAKQQLQKSIKILSNTCE